MLAIPLITLALLLVFMPLPSPGSAPKSVLSFTSHLVVIQQSFPLPISAMLSILSPLKRQKMQSRSPNLSKLSLTSPFPPLQFNDI